MATGISTNANTTGKAACLASNGVDFVFRYYSKPGSSKALTPAEAADLSKARIAIGAVFQFINNSAGYFTTEHAVRDAQWAYANARAVGQPEGTAIYVGVDFDATLTELQQRILPYFIQFNTRMAELGGGANPYRLGVYGSGRSCRWLRANCPFVRFTWLALSTGWAEYGSYTGWNVKQRWGDGGLCGLKPVVPGDDQDYEFNDSDGDFGGFTVGVAPHAAPVALVLEAMPVAHSAAFTMRLGASSALQVGEFTLLDKAGNRIFVADASSGRMGRQTASHLSERGAGPLPLLSGGAVQTAIVSSESAPALGAHFRISPSSVRDASTGTVRGDFTVHGPESTPGSSGGIALLREADFDRLRELLTLAAGGGQSSVPLEIEYSGEAVPAPLVIKESMKATAVFEMELKKTSALRVGSFSISDGAGKELYRAAATSGLPGHQHRGDLWLRNHGPIPDDLTNGPITLETEEYYSATIGGLGYRILPDEFRKGDLSRGLFRVHFDIGNKGSAGCICIEDEGDFRALKKVMATLRAAKILTLPLTLRY